MSYADIRARVYELYEENKALLAGLRLPRNEDLEEAVRRLVEAGKLDALVATQTAGKAAARIRDLPGPDFPGCHLLEDLDLSEAELPAGSMVVEPKLDGYRIIALVKEAGQIVFSTRGGLSEPYTSNLQHVAEEISKLKLDSGWMLDGEVVGRDFNATSLVRHVRPDDATRAKMRSELVYHVFDAARVDQIEQVPRGGRLPRRAFNRPLVERRRWLEANFRTHGILPLSPLRLVERVGRVVCVAHALELAEEMNELGYEGIVLKDDAAPYVFDRDGSWRRIKAFKSIDVCIERAIEGQGKHQGRLGALAGRSSDGVELSVGTGFSDEQREELWASRDDLVGEWMEVRVQEVSASAARHPSFVRMRPDRSARKT
jgi:DNA ligase-1